VRQTRALCEGACEAGLAARRKTAYDNHERQPRSLREALGEDDQIPRPSAGFPVRCGPGRKLRGTDMRDLGPHQHPVRGVERPERIIARVAARIAISVDQCAAEPLIAVGGEIEHQKCEIIGDVERTGLRIELDAVDDLHTVIDDHVLGAEVRCPSRTSSRFARAWEADSVTDDERVREPLERERPVDLAALLDAGQQLVQVPLKTPLTVRTGELPTATRLARA
jgi:hypothetical protein